MLTVEFKINFLRPASGTQFVAIGRVARAGRLLIVCNGEVHPENQKTIALMQAPIVTPQERDSVHSDTSASNSRL